MSDRSELALQLTDAVAAAYQAIERAGNRAYKSFGLSQRAHAVMAAVDLGGPDGARPSDGASELGVSRAARLYRCANLYAAVGPQPPARCRFTYHFNDLR